MVHDEGIGTYHTFVDGQSKRIPAQQARVRETQRSPSLDQRRYPTTRKRAIVRRQVPEQMSLTTSLINMSYKSCVINILQRIEEEAAAGRRRLCALSVPATERKNYHTKTLVTELLPNDKT